MGLTLFPYETVRSLDPPDALAIDFLHAIYNAAADLAGWNRTALERPAR